MNNEEKYEALKTLLVTGENPRLFEWKPLDFVEMLWRNFQEVSE